MAALEEKRWALQFKDTPGKRSHAAHVQDQQMQMEMAREKLWIVVLVVKSACTVNENKERRKRKKKLENKRTLAETKSYPDRQSVGRVKRT